ncbi:MAG TPA: DUF58 domain-containing protein [Ktedonobacteraceae bacterium]
MNSEDYLLRRDLAPLKKRRFWYILAIVLCVLGLIIPQPLVFLAGLCILVIGVVPEIWYRVALQRLEIQQQIDQQHHFFGDNAVLTQRFENQKWLPATWLKVEAFITPPLTIIDAKTAQRTKSGYMSDRWMLSSFQQVTRRLSMPCIARGLYTIGPIRLQSSDPLGWLERELTLPLYETLLIYPPLASLDAFGLSSLNPGGDSRSARRIYEDPQKVVGVREYQVGDDFRRISWKATARYGSLKSKIYEYSSTPRLLLLLDCWNYARTWAGADQDIQELCIALVASLAVWALDGRYMVGLLTNGAMATATTAQSARQRSNDLFVTGRARHITPPGICLPFARHDGHYQRILATLAQLVPHEYCPIAEMLEREASMFSPGTTILFVSAATSVTKDTIERLEEFRKRKMAIHLVLAGSPDGNAVADMMNVPVQYVKKEKWYELANTIVKDRDEAIAASALHFQLD